MPAGISQAKWASSCWVSRGHGPQGPVHLLRHFGGHSEGQVAALPEAIRWQLTPHTTSGENYLFYVFSRDSSVSPAGAEEKAETGSKPQSFFCTVSLPPALTAACCARSQVPTCVCTSSGSASAISEETFPNFYLERIRHSPTAHRKEHPVF